MRPGITTRGSREEPAQTIEELPLELFFGPGVVVDATSEGGRRRGQRGGDGGRDRRGRPPASATGDIVLVRSGRDAFYGADDYVARGPGVTAEATRWLYRARRAGDGHRRLGLGPPAPPAGRPRRWSATSRGSSGRRTRPTSPYCQIERLVNLGELPSTRLPGRLLPAADPRRQRRARPGRRHRPLSQERADASPPRCTFGPLCGPNVAFGPKEGPEAAARCRGVNWNTTTVLSLLATAAIGALVALQPPVNSELGRRTSDLGAAFVSVSITFLLLGAILLAFGDVGSLSKVREVPADLPHRRPLRGRLRRGLAGHRAPSRRRDDDRRCWSRPSSSSPPCSTSSGCSGSTQVSLTPLRLVGIATLILRHRAGHGALSATDRRPDGER